MKFDQPWALLCRSSATTRAAGLSGDVTLGKRQGVFFYCNCSPYPRCTLSAPCVCGVVTSKKQSCVSPLQLCGQRMQQKHNRQTNWQIFCSYFLKGGVCVFFLWWQDDEAPGHFFVCTGHIKTQRSQNRKRELYERELQI